MKKAIIIIIAIFLINMLNVAVVLPEQEEINDVYVYRLVGDGLNNYSSNYYYNNNDKKISEVQGVGSSFDQERFLKFAVQNDTHIFIKDPTKQSAGYWIPKDLSFVELNSSRFQFGRHFYNVTSDEYIFNSDYLVNNSGVLSDTDWITEEEYPSRFLIRLTNGSIYSFNTVLEINNFYGEIDNSSIWAVGYETFDGIMAIYLNFQDLLYGHSQLLYYPRLINGRLPQYNQPLFAFYYNLYVKYNDIWYNQILNDRSLYDSPNKDPRNTLHFFENGEEVGIYYTTYGISIQGATFDFEHGFKFNQSDLLFHMIDNLRCRDRDFQDVGYAYEITTSPAVEGTAYQVDRFKLANSTYEIVLNVSELWEAETYLENFYSRIEIISQNNETFQFIFTDMEQSGFSSKYLSLHDQLFPSGETKRVLRAGMFNYGSYLQNTILSIDPTTGTKYTIDNLDINRDGTAWVTTSVEAIIGRDSGGDDRSFYIAFDTGIEEEISGTSSVSFEGYVTANSMDSGEGVYGRVYNIGGNCDSNTAKEDSQSSSFGTTTVTSAMIYDSTVSTGAYRTASATYMEELTDYWATNRLDSEEFISFLFYQSGADNGDYFQFYESQQTGTSQDPIISFTYTVPNIAPSNPTLYSDSGDTYAGKSHTVITDHTDGDGETDIDSMHLRYLYSTYDIQIHCHDGTSSGSVTVDSGSGYLIGTPTYSYTTDPVNGYRVSWVIILDWDFIDDQAYVIYGKTIDDKASDTGWISLDTNNQFENDLEVVSSTYTYPTANEYGGSSGTLESNDYFKTGFTLEITGSVEYEGSSQTFDDSYGSGTEVQWFWDNNDDGSLEDMGDSYRTTTITAGAFTISFTQPTGSGASYTTNANMDLAIQSIPSGGSDVTGSTPERDLYKDNANPSFSSYTPDPDGDSGGDGYAPNSGYEDDSSHQGDFSGCSDTGSGIAYYYIKSLEQGSYGSGDSDGLDVSCTLASGDNNIYYKIVDNVGNELTGDSGDNVYYGTTDPVNFDVDVYNAQGYPTDTNYIADSTDITSGSLWANTNDPHTFYFIVDGDGTADWGSGGAWKVVFENTGAGWGNGGIDTSAPYQSNNYDPSLGDPPSSIEIDIVNNCGERQQISITTDSDDVAPSGYSLSLDSDSNSGVGYTPNSGYYDDDSVDVTATAKGSITETKSGLYTDCYSYQRASEGWSAFQSGNTYIFTSTSDGSYTLYVKVVDNVGNIGSSQSTTVIVDTSDPTGFGGFTLEHGGGYIPHLTLYHYAYYSLSKIWFNAIHDPSDHFGYSIISISDYGNSGYWKTGYDLNSVFETAFWSTDSITTTKDHNFYGDVGGSNYVVRVCNNAGNYLEVANYETEADNTAPSVSFYSLVESSPYLYVTGQTVYFSDLMGGSGQTLTFTISGSDGSGVGVSTSGKYFSNFPPSGGGNYQTTTVKTYSVSSSSSSGSCYGTLFDFVGNEGNHITVTAIEDITNPSSQIDYEYEIQSHLYYAYGTSIQGCYGSDFAGTEEYRVGGISSDSGSGLDSVIDDTSFGGDPIYEGSLSDWEFHYQVSPSDNGDIIVTYLVYDKVGNCNNSAKYYFYEDNNPPYGYTVFIDPDLNSGAGYDPKDDEYDDDNTFNISITGAVDDLSGLATEPYQHGYNTSWASFTSSFYRQYSGYSDGFYMCKGWVIDNVGNYGSIGYDNVTLDTTIPSSFTVDWEYITGFLNGYYAYDNGTVIFFNSGEHEEVRITVNNDGDIGNSGLWKVELDLLDVFDDFLLYSLPTTQDLEYYGDSNGIICIRIVNNVGNFLEFNTTVIADSTDPSFDFTLTQDPDRYEDNYDNDYSIETVVSNHQDSGSGLPTTFVAYKIISYGAYVSTTTYTGWNILSDGLYNLYAKVIDYVGNYVIHSLQVTCDTILPYLEYFSLDEMYAPYWYDQDDMVNATATVTWIEAYPYTVNISISPNYLAYDNDTSPSGLTSIFQIIISGELNGLYTVTVIISDKAGNTDSTLISPSSGYGTIGLDNSLSGIDVEVWFYFYFFKSNGLGLDWKDFNVSYIVDEGYYAFHTEERIRGSLYAQKFLNKTSSIRFIVRDYFGNILLNSSYTLPRSRDLYLTLNVNTFKVCNIYNRIMNLTLSRNSATFEEQIMPFEIFRWELFASVYNLTVMIHGTNEYASDDQLNMLYYHQVNLTLTSVAIFIDLVYPSFLDIPTNNTAVEWSNAQEIEWEVDMMVDWQIYKDSLIVATGTSTAPKYIVPATELIGTYNLTVWINNINQKHNISTIFYIVQDTIAPTLSPSYANNTIFEDSYQESILVFTVIESVTYLVYRNSTLLSSSVTSDNIYATITGVGIWNITIYLEDINSVNISYFYFYDIRDRTLPVIYGDTTKSVQVGDTFSLFYSISELNPSTYAIYFLGNIVASGSYTDSISYSTSFSTVGSYTFLVYVYDTSSNIKVFATIISVTNPKSGGYEQITIPEQEGIIEEREGRFASGFELIIGLIAIIGVVYVYKKRNYK